MDRFEEALAQALAVGRIELVLEFRRSAHGEKTGTIVIRDGDGATLTTLPAESPEAMNLTLARLVELGFRVAGVSAAPAHATERQRLQAKVPVAGVDGYRKGWVAVSLDPSGAVDVSTHATFGEVLSLRAVVIAVDIPIDPTGRGSRPADPAARAFVGGRGSSVFPTAPRPALQAATFAEANEIARSITGKGLSQQAYALAPKILEVDELAQRDERVIEAHPEVSFCRLAGAPLTESKHTPRGLERRRALLAGAGLVLPDAVAGVREVDLLDAAAAAWTAARYAVAEAEALPSGHTDRLGAIWA